MTDGWTSPSTIVSAIAAFAAIAAAVISWLHYRTSRSPKGVVGKLSVSRQPFPAGMVRLYAILQNESSSTWDNIVLEVSLPRNAPWSFSEYIRHQAELEEISGAYTEQASRRFRERFEALANRGPVKIERTLYEIGSKSFRGDSSTDVTSLDLVVSEGSIRSARKLRIKVMIRSTDAVPRRMVVIMTRNTAELLRDVQSRLMRVPSSRVAARKKTASQKIKVVTETPCPNV